LFQQPSLNLLLIFLAERLWSAAIVRDYKEAFPRLNEWRCRMTGRGLPAEPDMTNVDEPNNERYGYCPEPYDPFDNHFNLYR
jgi:hypothetical protein